MRTRRGKRLRGAAGMATIALVAASGVAALASEQTAAAAPPASTCQLGNGVKHVVSLVFDNVHFFRDNPNVPSDLEQMPHLLNFLKSNGTVLSNVHTPLIAHTADDSLTIYTGLYGDRHGQPVSNSYKTYNPDGTTDPATSFAYWTAPVSDTENPPTAGHDTTPTMVYSDTVPASRARPTGRPRRRGCRSPEPDARSATSPPPTWCWRTSPRDIPAVFGPNSPEAAQAAADPDSFKDAEVADYIGVAVHCAQGDATCANAQAVKFGQTTPSPSAAEDSLPTEPGGYTGFQALFGARYVAPQLGAGTPNLIRNGYQVTDAAGNLVDLNGHDDQSSRSATNPGSPASARPPRRRWPTWPTCRRPASPVTYGYISDLHERKAGTSGCTTATGHRNWPAARAGRQLLRARTPRHYDAAFETFFQRLAADGITPANTVVHDRRGGERPVRRRERGPGDPADTGRLRWRHHGVPLRERSDRRAGCEHQGPALDDIQQRHRSSTSSRRARRSTCTGSRRLTTRPCASSNATPPR